MGRIKIWLSSPYLLLLIAACLWGGNFVVGKSLVSSVPPFSLAFLRWSVAFLAIIPFCGSSVYRDHKLYIRHWRKVIFLSLTGVAGFNTLLYVAVQYTSAINAALMNSATPMMIVLLSSFLLRAKYSYIRMIGIVVSFSGVIWIICRGDLTAIFSLSFNQGDIWMIFAVTTWALYSIGMRKWASSFPVNGLFAVTIFVALIVLLPFVICETVVSHRSIQINWSIAAGILFIGLLASIAAFSCWNRAVLLIGPSRCAGFLNFIPLFSALFATIFTEERLLMFHVVGGALVFAGVYVTAKSRESKP